VVTGKVKIVDGEMVKRQPEELKDSGVEWLGMIPKDWGIRKIKRLSNIGRGASPRPIDNPRYFDDTGEYAWTRIADVTASGKFLLHTKQTTSKLGANLSVKLEPQDLFISIAGSVGKPCITKIKACIHDGFVYLPKLKNKYVEFLYYIFYIGQCYRGLGKLGTQLNLNRETIGNIDIALPLTDTEINSIIKYIVYKEGRIEYLTATIASEIQKLKQAKQSLISEAVTGKIDLRDWEITQEGGIQ
jgi:type I restriction enzyme S subunit